MSNFTNELLVTPLPDGKTWRLERNLTYHLGCLGNPDHITVPNGFLTDFATVPRLLWWLIPRWGKHGNAAVLHDWLYYEKRYTRAITDAIFLEALGVLGVGKVKRYAMFFAVRVFGRWAWRRKTLP